MNNYLIYLFEANCTLLVLGLFYYAFLRNETDFRKRRIYLLGSSLLALIIPLLNFDLIPDQGEAIKGMQTLLLPEIVIGGGEIREAEVVTSEFAWVSSLYWGGVVLLTMWLLFQLGQVCWFFLANTHRLIRNGYHVIIKTNGTLPTFSFFNLLFLDDSVGLSGEEENKVIAHEMAHIKQLHSFDILFFETVKILFWFNPISWFNRKEVQELHEYLADDVILKDTSPEDYSDLLARMALNKAHLSIGHHFNKSKTLKRINMMKTTKTKIRNWKWASLVPLVAILFIAFSCNDEAMNDLNTVVEGSALAVDVPENIKIELAKLKEQYPDAEFEYIETSLDNEDEVARLKEMDPKTIAMVDVNKEENRLGMIVRKDGVLNQVAEKTGDGETFLVVEDTAEPVGGFPEFYKYIAENLKYPESAKEKGIEGKVYIQMVIDTDGSITDVKAVKGIGYGCDEEAVRVISEAPAWQPAEQRGKKVKQKIVVPIAFTLGGDNQSLGSNSAPPPAPTQLKTDFFEMKLDVKRSGNSVYGKVFGENGEPLAGTNVIIKGTTRGTVCDHDGSFKIQLDDPNQEVVFSYIGYETVKLANN